MGTEELLQSGHYARKQLYCPSRIIRWSHTSRFRLARDLVARYRGTSLLDYGCGDGTFIALTAGLFPRIVGADINPRQIDDCVTRFAPMRSVEFLLVSDLTGPRHDSAYAVVVCMETLEHCTAPVVESVIADLDRLVARDGVVIVSVPVECGPALLIKQILRRIFGWRHLGDYQFYERYPWKQLLTMLLATSRTSIDRPIYRARADDPESEHHSHMGFNWRSLRARLSQTFDVRATRFSPLNWSHGLLSSQAWFICHPRRQTAR